MARNDDRARERRAKRRGEDPTPNGEDAAGAEGAAAPGDDASADLSSEVRAENAAHEELTGSPIDLGKPGDEPTEDDKLVVGGEASPAKQGGPRFVKFLRASWAELQRVIWPNRQQVAQGTAVTLGFVLIAGVYLGVADVVAQQIVNLII